MGKIVKNYESFRGIEPVKEEFIFKALANLFKGLFKKIKDKIEKLGEDFNAQKTLIKTDIINPKNRICLNPANLPNFSNDPDARTLDRKEALRFLYNSEP